MLFLYTVATSAVRTTEPPRIKNSGRKKNHASVYSLCCVYKPRRNRKNLPTQTHTQTRQPASQQPSPNGRRHKRKAKKNQSPGVENSWHFCKQFFTHESRREPHDFGTVLFAATSFTAGDGFHREMHIFSPIFTTEMLTESKTLTENLDAVRFFATDRLGCVRVAVRCDAFWQSAKFLTARCSG